jgi:hypothetical protein
MLLQHLSVNVHSFSELHLESLVFFLGSEFGAKLFCLRLFIRNVVSCPCPRVIAGLQLLQFAENVFLNDVVVHDALMSFIRSDQHSDIARSFVPKETQFSNPSFFPLFSEAIDFGLELGKFFLFFLPSDLWDFREINKFPVSDNFSLYVFIVITSGLFVFVFFGFGLFYGFFCL